MQMLCSDILKKKVMIDKITNYTIEKNYLSFEIIK